jgi:PAS domain S-box-containing protein
MGVSADGRLCAAGARLHGNGWVVERLMTQREPDVDVTHALEQLTVPASVVDRDGRIRWMNRGAIDLVGDRVGQPFVRAVAPEDVHRARRQFAKKVIGEASSTEYTMTLLDQAGRRVPVRVSSAPLLENGEITGVFGIAYRDGAAGPFEAPQVEAGLTARQHETLALLADGLGTLEIADRLGVAEDTARNHIRALLRHLDAHTRLEAVVRAYRLGLLAPRRDE